MSIVRDFIDTLDEFVADETKNKASVIEENIRESIMKEVSDQFNQIAAAINGIQIRLEKVLQEKK